MKKSIFILGSAVLMAIVMGCSKKTQVTINSEADLAGLNVGCQAGTTGEIYITEEIEGVNVKSFKSGIDASLSLKNGAIDAVVLDELPAKEIVKRNPDLKILDIPFAKEEYSIAVRKNDGELLASINNTIAQIKADGTYDSLIKAFMPAEGEITVPETIACSGSKTLKMGTNSSFAPFEYMEGTSVVGFDVTLSQMIARDYGCKLEVKDMNFDGLIAALQSGAIDFIASGMSATDERRKNVDFSDPYYSSCQVIIVRK